ncbi:putative dsRNA-binding protein [Nocardioides sp. NPDC092400]|uniref:putative dsRNA-binding protein n=1 Tax=Nocardioides sp. NPDC092400 TaxID=3155196 RepID=UPI0034456CD2
MTAYSFGARWVGVVAFRSSPSLVPEPLHKMAERLHARAGDRSIVLGDGRSLPASTMLKVLPRIRTRYLLAGDAARAAECLQVERAVRGGGQPRLREWLIRELPEPPRKQSLTGSRKQAPPGALTRSPQPQATRRVLKSGQPTLRRPIPPSDPRISGPRPPQAPARSHRRRPPVEIRDTGWRESYPHAPESPWLPELPPSLESALRECGLELDAPARQWLRWASLHTSYVHESVPDERLSPGALRILQTLGRNWMRLAMVEYVPTLRADFASNAELSHILAQDARARHGIANWLRQHGGGWYGRGERVAAEAGTSRSAGDVAMQIVGALSMVTASTAPATALLRASDFRASEPEPDWGALVRAATQTDPRVSRSEAGPDHLRTFTVTVTAGGQMASGTARSAKAARMTALRAWVTEHAPHLIPAARPPASAAAAPQLYPTCPAAHLEAVQWAMSAFETDAPGLFTQALTHRSWAYDNRAAVERSDQRDYGVLATEGSELVRTLVHHHHALIALSSPATVPMADLTATVVTEAKLADLFDHLGLTDAVLRSRGMGVSTEVKSDVIQALAAAAWRAQPGRLAHRQFAQLEDWVRSFVPRRDPTTMLQEYGATHRVEFVYEFRSRGAEHQRQFQAQVTLANDPSAVLAGGWCTSKTAAKHAAAGRLLRLLSGEQVAELSTEETDVLRACLRAELRAVTPEGPTADRDLLAGRMGLDRLISGDYSSFGQWATARSRVLSGSASGVLTRVGDYYTAALTHLRRQQIRRLIKSLLPRLHPHDDPAHMAAISAWLAGPGVARLALIEDLLGAVVWQRNAPDAAIAFVQQQTAVIASTSGSSAESTLTTGQNGKTLTIRVAERDLSSAVAPLVDTVEAVVSGTSWVREGDTVALTLSTPPRAQDPIATRAFHALESSWTDPWLSEARHALSELLGAADATATNARTTTTDDSAVATALLGVDAALRST